MVSDRYPVASVYNLCRPVGYNNLFQASSVCVSLLAFLFPSFSLPVFPFVSALSRFEVGRDNYDYVGVDRKIRQEKQTRNDGRLMKNTYISSDEK